MIANCYGSIKLLTPCLTKGCSFVNLLLLLIVTEALQFTKGCSSVHVLLLLIAMEVLYCYVLQRNCRKMTIEIEDLT